MEESAEDLLSDLQKHLSAMEARMSPMLEIQIEPALISCDFLRLECMERDIGRAMAMRNYWASLCSR